MGNRTEMKKAVLLLAVWLVPVLSARIETYISPETLEECTVVRIFPFSIGAGRLEKKNMLKVGHSRLVPVVHPSYVGETLYRAKKKLVLASAAGNVPPVLLGAVWGRFRKLSRQGRYSEASEFANECYWKIGKSEFEALRKSLAGCDERNAP